MDAKSQKLLVLLQTLKDTEIQIAEIMGEAPKTPGKRGRPSKKEAAPEGTASLPLDEEETS